MTDALKAREAPDRLAGLAVGIKAALGKLSTSSLTFHVERETAEALLSLLQSPPAQTSDEGTERFGCHLELHDGQEPDGCVIDDGLHRDCLYAHLPDGSERTDKTTCKYWKPVVSAHHPEAGAPSRDAWAEAERDGMAPVASLGRTPPALKASDLEREGLREQLIAILDPIAHSLPNFRQGNINNGADQIIALIASGGDHSSRAVPLSTISDGWRPTHRHVKRGTDYQVIGEARLQQAGQFGPNEGDRLTVYLGADGKLWARATSEFYDGRFEPLPASPDLSEGDR